MYIFVDMVLKIIYYMCTFIQKRQNPWTRKTLSRSAYKYSLWRSCSYSWQTKRQQKWNQLHCLVSRHRLLLLSSIRIRPSILRTVKRWREMVFKIKEEPLWVVVKSFLLSSHTSPEQGLLALLSFLTSFWQFWGLHISREIAHNPFRFSIGPQACKRLLKCGI